MKTKWFRYSQYCVLAEREYPDLILQIGVQGPLAVAPPATHVEDTIFAQIESFHGDLLGLAKAQRDGRPEPCNLWPDMQAKLEKVHARMMSTDKTSKGKHIARVLLCDDTPRGFALC